MQNSTFVHKYLKGLITNKHIAVDMTCGNGNDTLFLAQHACFVYAIDISQEAITKTMQRTNNFNNIKLICDNHVNIDNYIENGSDFFVFNLGYLPYADKYSVTKAQETLIAFKKALEILRINGYLVITFYRGHPGGKDEYYLLTKYIKDQKINVINIYQQHLKQDEPVTYIIKKI